MKRIFNYFIGIIAFLLVLLLMFNREKPSFVLVNKAPDFVKEVVNHLNQNPEFKGKNYKIYTTGFDKGGIVPHLANRDEKAILWLGGSLKTNIDGVDKFGVVLTSNPFLERKIAKSGGKAFFVPVGYENKVTLHPGNDFIIIGQQAEIEEILQQKGLKFRQYSWQEVLKNPGVIDGAKAVIASDALLENKQTVIPEAIFAAVLAKIPVVTFWFGGFSTFNWFNDNINFYVSTNDAAQLIDDIVKDEKIIRQRADKNEAFVRQYFDAAKVSKQIADIITGQVKKEEKKPATIKIGIKTNVGQYGSGDYWLARYMKDYFEKNNYEADIVFADSQFLEPAEVYLRLRGDILKQDLDDLSYLNVWYQIYFHQKTLEQYLALVPMIMKHNDVFISASKFINDKVREQGFESNYLPQFTDTAQFYFDENEDLKSEVLFVGNYHFHREGVLWAYQQGLPLTIYGDYYPQGIAKEKYVDNRILRQYYSSAKIVLNDTVAAMREYGFISNRIFDATACGTLVISDYMPEIEEIYGNSVPMYKNKEELVKLVTYYLAHDKEREMLAKKAQKITLDHFTAEKILPELNQIIQKAKAKKGIK